MGTVAGSAFADATLYGGFDLGLAQQSATAHSTSGGASGPSVSGMNGAGVQSNYWGLKGTEDLGGGLRSEYKLEGQINPETGAAHTSNGIFDRAAYVGLSSNSMGAIHFGVEVAPYIVNSITAVPNIGFSQSVATLVGVGLLHGFFIPNAITYHSPNMSGLQVDLQYANGGSTAPSNGAYYDGSLTYTTGALKLGAAYDMQKAGTQPGLGGSTTPITDNESNSNVNASYDFGSYKVGIAQIHSVVNTSTAGVQVTNNATEIGASFNASAATTLYATYVSSTNNNAGDGRSSLTSLAARYNLSKSTAVYGYFNHVNDQANAGNGGFDSSGAGLQSYVKTGVYATSANPFSANVIGVGMLMNF
jgi:predicted porin